MLFWRFLFSKAFFEVHTCLQKNKSFSTELMSHISCLITLFEIAYLNGNLNAFLNSFLIVRAVILMGCSCITKDSVMRSKQEKWQSITFNQRKRAQGCTNINLCMLINKINAEKRKYLLSSHIFVIKAFVTFS